MRPADARGLGAKSTEWRRLCPRRAAPGPRPDGSDVARVLAAALACARRRLRARRLWAARKLVVPVVGGAAAFAADHAGADR